MSAQSPGGIGAQAALWWVRVYTAGLACEAKERRRAEVESDVWEQAADARVSGIADASAGIETLGRTLRGIPADVVWRFQVEGPQLNIHVPIERVAGVFLLLLVAASALSFAANGYDASASAANTELTRLAETKTWEATVYTLLQVLAGIVMIAAAGVFYHHLRGRSPAASLVAAFFLVAAGLLTMVSSALYATAAEMADEWQAAAPADEAAARHTARAFLLALGAAAEPTIATLVLGVHTVAVLVSRHRLVPAGLRFVALGSLAALLIGLGGTALGHDMVEWLGVSAGVMLTLVWLLLAGGWLLFSGAGGGSTAGSLRTDNTRDTVRVP